MTDKLSGEKALADVLEALPADERLILPCLQHLQRALGFVAEDAVDAVAGFLNVSRAEVVGVLTYYHDLRRTPPPAVSVGLCVAEACQAQGARALAGALEAEFGLRLGQQNPGGPIELAKVYCLGNCALGPAAMVGGRLIGRCDLAAVKTAVTHAREASR